MKTRCNSRRKGSRPSWRSSRAARGALGHVRGRGLRLEPLEQRRLLTAITVTDLADTMANDGVVTLREAIHAANTDSPVNEAPAGSGADTIEFDPDLFTSGPQTLTLAGVELAITDDLTITGPAEDLLTIDAGQLSRIFNVDDGSDSQIQVVLSGLTMTRGGVLGASGAGISNEESLRIDGCVISDCDGVRLDVNIFGGGIWSAGPLEIYDTTITDNHSVYGGGISTSSTLLIVNSTISHNSTTVCDGGGIHSSGNLEPVTIIQCILSQNDAKWKGGAIAHRAGLLEIVDSTISDNSAREPGGGIDARGGDVSIANTTISGNHGSTGGGIYVGSGNVTITDSTISNNIGSASGGAMCVYSPSKYSWLEVANTLISQNTAGKHGGGIFAAVDTRVTESTISNNEAANMGGGVWHERARSLVISRTTVCGNRVDARGKGGGVATAGGEIAIINSTVSGNAAPGSGLGGGVYIGSDAAGPWSIDNSTIAGNTADTGGGLRLASGTLSAWNTIFADNSAVTLGPDVSGSVDGDYNLVEDAAGAFLLGANNITGLDPVLGPLADNGGPTQTHALLPSSPAIDAGDPDFDPNAFDPPLLTDQRGFNRIADGDGDGLPRVDVGAFEADSSLIVVNSTADPGDGIPDTTETTLREAIDLANATLGTQTIVFDIPTTDPGYNADTGAFTIQPLSALPTITDPVVIDGYTQPGAAPNTNPIDQASNAVLKIELDGSLAGDGVNGLTITAGGSTVHGLVINRFAGNGIAVEGGNGNAIEGNFIGTDVTGSTALANAECGVAIYDAAQSNRIGTDGDGIADAAERNVISGNSFHGVGIYGEGTDSNVVAGNYVGVDVTGAVALGNGFGSGYGRGVAIDEGAKSNLIGTDGDGVADAAERNVISANRRAGVLVSGTGSNGNVVAGNYIGTDSSGTSALGNHLYGVLLVDWGGGPQANLVGTNGDGVADEAERNVISGNRHHGVLIVGAGTDSNVVAGNYIGTDVSGTAALGNGFAIKWGYGVLIQGAAQSNRVGTNGDGVADASERNVISGNADNGVGVAEANTNHNVVAGNFIGTDATGTAALGNGNHGIKIEDGASWNRVGTNGDGVADTAERNVISGNGNTGVAFQRGGTVENVVAGNFIGTDVTGTVAIGNGAAGVGIWNGVKRTLIGTNGDGIADAAEGNLISGNGAAGVEILREGADFNVVAGNYIGTDVTGAAALGNGECGVAIYDGAQSNQIGTNGDGVADAAERNVISANADHGVRIADEATDANVVAGNFIGTDASGTAPLGNGFGVEWGFGVMIYGGAQSNLIGTDGDGVADEAERNVISANSAHGVSISAAGTDFNVVAGNYIGTDVSGTLPLANGLGTDWGNGVAISSGPQSNRIGTNGDGLADEAERNVISGNNNSGVYLADSGTNHNVVAGNYLGADVTGTVALANGEHGVAIAGGAQSNRIGTDGDGVADEAERNVISGNTSVGVNIAGIGSDHNVVAGNFIGTDATGTAALANGWYGVRMREGPQSNRIGTNGDGIADVAERNVISANSRHGVVIAGARTDANVVAGNYIGTDVSGTAALGNGVAGESYHGVVIHGGVQYNLIGTDGDGVADEAERNVISASAKSGVWIAGSGTDHNVVAGNYIGTDATGMNALGNGYHGVHITNFGGGPQANLIGTDGDGVADEAERNVISGNANDGVRIEGEGTDFNVVAGNHVGTDVAGTIAVANGYDGIAIHDGAYANRVGTDGNGVADEAERNLISGNANLGVRIYGAGTDGNVVAGNYVGTDVSGTLPLGNGFGVEWGHAVVIGRGAQFNFIGTNGDDVADAAERNVISANAKTGVVIQDAETDHNVVAGNYIGTDASGLNALGNGQSGVLIQNRGEGGPQANLIGTDGDGVADEAERNVISGNLGTGVVIAGEGTDSNVIAGNYIGSDLSGTVALGNGKDGVRVDGGAQWNRIGVGEVFREVAGEVVVEAEDFSARRDCEGREWLVVPGEDPGDPAHANYRGTGFIQVLPDTGGLWTDPLGEPGPWVDYRIQIDTPGDYQLYVRWDGHDEASDSFYAQILELGDGLGGSVADWYRWSGLDAPIDADFATDPWRGIAAVESTSGGGDDVPAIWPIATPGHYTLRFIMRESGAAIDTFVLQLAGLPAPTGDGPAESVVIMDDANVSGNVIAFNPGTGVAVVGEDTTGNRIQGNSIYANGALGIDLGGDGVTFNDPGDADTGPNHLQNYPVNSLVVPGDSTRVVGTLNSIPNSEFALDFYANTTPDPFGFDEGERWLGSTVVTTDGAGDVDFDVVLPSATTAGETVTATATDAYGNTSEFPPARDYSAEYTSAVMHDGPFAYYRLGEAAGATTAVDETGVHHGAYVNDPTLEVPGAILTDPDNTAAEFDETQYVEGTTMGDYGSRMIHGFTIECWVRLSVPTDWQNILGTANPGYTTNVQLSVDATKSMRLYFRDDDWDRYSVWFHTEGHNADIFDQQWHHLVFAYEPIPANPSDRFDLYVDSVPQELEVQPGNDRPDGTSDFVYPMILGGWHQRGTVIPTYEGDLDEVAFYTRPLSWTEAGEHYGAGVGNHVPMAIDDAYYVKENTQLVVAAESGLLANDSDADGDPLEALWVGGPSHGTLTLEADGSFTYEPDADFRGVDTFTYKATDAEADSNVATVTIVVADEGGLIDVALTAVLQPSPSSLPGSTLPEPIEEVAVGSTYYLEVWVQDKGAPGVGVTGGTLDIHYTTAFADCMAIMNADFDILTSGACDEPNGLVDDLGGGTLTAGAGVAPLWARLAYVELVSTGVGNVTYELSPGDLEFSRYGQGIVPWEQVDLSDVVTISQAPGIRVETTLTRQPTPLDDPGTGEVETLPENLEWIDEWGCSLSEQGQADKGPVYVEIWGRVPDPLECGVSSFSFDLAYNTEVFTATSIECGPAFANDGSGSIDDTAGSVHVEATTTGSGVGDDRNALLATVVLECTEADPGCPHDASGEYIAPLDDPGIRLENVNATLEGVGPAAVELGDPPETDVWPAMYDVDDDASIGFGDLAFFATAFHECVEDPNTSPFVWASDFDRSGCVDFGDLAFFASNFRRSKTDPDPAVYPGDFPEDWLTEPGGLPEFAAAEMLQAADPGCLHDSALEAYDDSQARLPDDLLPYACYVLCGDRMQAASGSSSDVKDVADAVDFLVAHGYW